MREDGIVFGEVHLCSIALARCGNYCYCCGDLILTTGMLWSRVISGAFECFWMLAVVYVLYRSVLYVCLLLDGR